LREPRRSNAYHPRGSLEEETDPKTPEADLVRRSGWSPSIDEWLSRPTAHGGFCPMVKILLKEPIEIFL
jgi:hypothetical protein